MPEKHGWSCRPLSQTVNRSLQRSRLSLLAQPASLVAHVVDRFCLPNQRHRKFTLHHSPVVSASPRVASQFPSPRLFTSFPRASPELPQSFPSQPVAPEGGP